MDQAAAALRLLQTALAFGEAYKMLHRRISVFTALPLEILKRQALTHHLDEIGRTPAVRPETQS